MSTYREAYGVFERERAAAAQVATLLAERAPALRNLAARRNARLVGGTVGLVGAALTAASLALGLEVHAPTLLVASLAASVAAYALLRALPGWLPREWPAISRSFERLESWSLAMPLMAAAFLGPLTLHAVIALLMTGGDLHEWSHGFGKWMVLSGVIVGHAHLVLAVLAARFARRLARTPSSDLASDPIRRSWLSALWITVGVAAVPGVVLLAIPPILTLVTGLVLIPTMYLVATRTVTHERMMLHEAEDALTGVRVGIEEIEEAREELYAEPELTGCRSSG